MFVALSTFTIVNNVTKHVKRAFIERPHLVDSAPGFVRMEVISPFDSPVGSFTEAVGHEHDTGNRSL